ncbi:hypothetical protein ES702_01859 [subsurface metagenome]
MSTRRDRYRVRDSNVQQHTAEQAGDFLFDTGTPPDKLEDRQKWVSQALDQRTRVMGQNVMSALTFYDILYLGFKSDAARIVGDTLKRLLIGKDGLGRDEAKTILTQSLPREIEIETGQA